MIEINNIEKYNALIDKNIHIALDIAQKARQKGYDPESEVNIPLAKNMAERVEGLISAVTDKLKGTGMSKRIVELEKLYGALDWRVGFVIAEEVAKEKFTKFEDKKTAMEIGIRTGFAYLTGGIVSAPLEGFIELKIKKRNDGNEYFSVCYAGPIRGAGGTAAATSVILSDYVRIKMGYFPYDPTEEEVQRYITEIIDYQERVTNLQYFPSREEIEFIVRHVPVEVNGDPTETIEVSNYKDLKRVETNAIRGGVCLVIAEGLSQKAPKLWKRIEKWGKDMGLEWGFLDEFIKLKKKIQASKEITLNSDEKKEKSKLMPNYTFIADLVAGRPILTFPLTYGGFRLRYGRARTTGFSAAGIHPASMIILDRYVATGTQLKIERPGKAAAMNPVDDLECPIVLLEDDSVVHIYSVEQAKKLVTKVKKILFLGDILINYGDFSENGHFLVPPGYCTEWWVLELEKKIVDIFGSLDLEKLADLVNISSIALELIIKEPFKTTISSDAAFTLSEKINLPLHPAYTLYWTHIKKEDLLYIFDNIGKFKIMEEEGKINRLIIPFDQRIKNILELIGMPHFVATKEFIIIEKEWAKVLTRLLQLKLQDLKKYKEIIIQSENILSALNSISGIIQRDKAGTFIGARMGRPEKAKMRKLTGSPHGLFPVGEEGGRLRCFQEALKEGKVTGDFPIYTCEKCNIKSVYSICHKCNNKTKQLFFCKSCGADIIDNPCKIHGKCYTHKNQTINIKEYFESALLLINMKTYPDLIKGVKGTANKDRIPENLAKSILRAKHDIYVNKDGTTRFDMSELPITSFKPKEIGITIEKVKSLGYEYDVYGKLITNENQIIQLFSQDIILPDGDEALDEQAGDVLLRVAAFLDELLVLLYKAKPFYNLKEKNDLVGHLVIGLAPHISAGTVGRIVGFSKTQGMYAHPLFHAAMRRDCDGDEACVMLLLDSFLNFSRQFLPDKRGGRTMDSPLVLTSVLNPSEVDDQALGIDVAWKYPLEFYQAALQMKNPWDVKIEQIKHRLENKTVFYPEGFTHNVTDINQGVNCSAYKTLPTMDEKLHGQMFLAEKIAAVNESEVAKAIIEKHFIKDIRGNLRKFSMQKFRCVKCNEKFSRPPLIGKCTKCGGKIIFTISEGSIIKYLAASINLANKYNIPAYLKQSLELTKRRIESVFGKAEEKQEGLNKWFG